MADDQKEEKKETTLQPHQQRVVDEKGQLEEKLEKLKAFFEKENFASLEEQDQNLLRQQASIMEQYVEVLGDRIKRF